MGGLGQILGRFDTTWLMAQGFLLEILMLFSKVFWSSIKSSEVEETEHVELKNVILTSKVSCKIILSDGKLYTSTFHNFNIYCNPVFFVSHGFFTIFPSHFNSPAYRGIKDLLPKMHLGGVHPQLSLRST